MAPFKLLSSTFLRGKPASDGPPSLAPPASRSVFPVSYASNSLTTAAALLKDVGEMTSRVPYLKAAAGVLLRIVEINDQIVVYKEQWADVTENLARAAQLVRETSVYCDGRGYSDLPLELQRLLSSLKGDLDDIQQILNQCRSRSKWAQLKLNILRSDMSTRIARCDRKMQNTLDACNAALLFSIRTSQHDKQSKVIDRSCTLLMDNVPSRPQVFHGRDDQIETILRCVAAHPHTPARIAILGPGGIGKTSLALTIVHHSAVQTCYKDAIYYVSCDACTSAAALLAELAKIFKISLDDSVPIDQQVISYLGSCSSCMLCLDNFETTWDQEFQEKLIVESLLSRMTALPRVALLLTMRGEERPAGTAWTRPLLPPLQPFDFDAAKKTFEEISGKWDEWAEMTIKAVECLPLAVTLLAHLAQSLSCQQLWQRWEEKHIASVERYKGHKLTSLELSIRLSLEGSRIKAEPGALLWLSILSILPGGLNLNKAQLFQSIFSNSPDLLQSMVPLMQSSLVYTSMDNRLHTHSLIQYYCQVYHPPVSEHLHEAEMYYVRLAQINSDNQADVYQDKLSEIHNTTFMLCSFAKKAKNMTKEQSLSFINAALAHSIFIARLGLSSESLFNAIVSEDGFLSELQRRQIFIVWAQCLLTLDCADMAKLKLVEILNWCEQNNDIACKGDALYGLGDVAMIQKKKDIALAHYTQALEMHDIASDVEGQAKDLNQIGTLLLFYKNNVNDAEECLVKSHALFKSIDNKIGQGNILWTLGDMCVIKGVFEEGTLYYHKALDIFSKLNSYIGQGDVLQSLGRLSMLFDDNDKAIDYYQRALQLFEQAKHRARQANALRALGEIHRRQGKHSQAFVYHQDALNIYISRNDISEQADSLQWLARLYGSQGQIESAVKTYTKAYDLHEKVEDHNEQGWDLYYLGELYYYNDQLHVARHCWECSFFIHEKCAIDKSTYGNTLYMMGLTYFEQDNTEIGKALDCYRRAFLLCEDETFFPYKGNIMEGFGDLYLYEDQFEAAHEHYWKAIVEYKKTKHFHDQHRVLTNLTELYTKQDKESDAAHCLELMSLILTSQQCI
ncbi:TPR-like protein [Artomyces pyxidatus]|uniref:TPR-like protein n=1 Tax=Artomyces pyxidatus TaxID=48021 RepID=A0ACB8SJH5_9AGAM|nr:TPR-like protein [Artomyces pyxidatus]